MKTVQILGKGRGIAPSFNTGVERWGINDLAFLRYSGEFDDWTRWFDLHTVERIQQRRPQAWEWYQRQTRPVYLLHTHADIPASLAYPKDNVIRYFRTSRFGSSFDYMFALAIYEGFEKIEICWCPMKQVVEYQNQTKTAHYWIGQAEARGIEVVIHGDSALAPNPKLYGFEVTYN